MDIPVHIAAAAVTCQAVLALDHHPADSSHSKIRSWVFGVGYFALGALSHLFLDAIPHYDVLYKLGKTLQPAFLPGIAWTLLKVGVLSLPIMIMFLYFTREHPGFALAALAGGLYPDFEKGGYLSSYLPRSLVLFPFHSCAYSSAGWEVEYRYPLIAGEVGFLLVLLALMYWFGQRQHAQYEGPDSSFKAWCKETLITLTSFAFIILKKTVGRFSLRQLTLMYLFSLVAVFALSDAGWFQQVRAELSVHLSKTWIQHFPPRLPYDDKIAHFFMMGLLALLVNLSLHISSFRIGRLKVLKGSVLVFTFIAIEEGTQMLFPARTFSWTDLMAGYLGVICIDALIHYLIYHRPVCETKLPTILANVIYQHVQQ